MIPTTFKVTARDGVKLATDVYRPDGQGPFPVILERTPYGRNVVSRSERTASEPRAATRAELAAYFVAHGYAVVYQDCRGRYGSEGEFVKYLSEGRDGYDTCAWLLEQDWCDGRICTMGHSYGCQTQLALGALDAPGVVAQALDSGGFFNAWRGGIRTFGAFELKQLTWAHQQAILSPEATRDPVMKAALEAEDMAEWFTRFPWKEGHSPLRHHPAYERYIFSQWRHGTFDDYWRQNGIWTEGSHAGYSGAACLHMSSWFDVYPYGAANNYAGLRDAGRGPQRLILGPWTHGDRSSRVFGDVDFGPDATIESWLGEWRAVRLRFFDHVIKGTAADVPPVSVFVMGGGTGRRTPAGHLDHGGRWLALENWPPPESKVTDYHLHADGRLSPDAPAADARPLRYNFDPSHPVPTIGHALTREPLIPGGTFDQVEAPKFFGSRAPYLPLAARPDVLVFQTEQLTESIQIVGPIEATLWVATDGPDTDFAAKLIDVHPPTADYPHGYAMLLTDGILRLRYAEDPANPRFREPGEIVKITVTLNPTANLFLPGHRIRLDISSSNFPKFDVNSNTGEPEGEALCKRVSVNTVFVDASRPSHIKIPLLR
ncbi:CocE/NonD family hydrolase [Bosea minatitlanensis]|uniref:CocE/NonD family hydrolase n=1 Tax=Bosea minatitlanensis TaxID=128782 RepID=A0ABW0F469_9HYPH|nr:CocE/NonD family hydrolase [Bosea minatitlanensis]MCT4494171.1 CocE/NonD family hydrolase [Bosea minatitlanensis]